MLEVCGDNIDNDCNAPSMTTPVLTYLAAVVMAVALPEMAEHRLRFFCCLEALPRFDAGVVPPLDRPVPLRLGGWLPGYPAMLEEA